MEIVLRHEIEFDVEADVAVEDVVKSLEGNSKLLREAARFIGALVPGLELEPKKVSVVHLSQQSPLREVFALGAFLAFQKDLEEEVPALIKELTGVQVPDSYDTLVTVVVLIIAVYGISTAFEKLFPKRDRSEIEAAKEGLFRKLSARLGKSVDFLRNKLADWLSTRKRAPIVKASQRLFAPTRGQPRALIRSRGGDEMLSSDFVLIAQAAAGLPFEEEDEARPRQDNKFERNVRIVLHAMDRDRRGSGWAGHIPSLFDERVPMDLDKGIAPESVFGKDEVTGDVLIKLEENDEGEMKPVSFLLLQAYLQ